MLRYIGIMSHSESDTLWLVTDIKAIVIPKHQSLYFNELNEAGYGEGCNSAQFEWSILIRDVFFFKPAARYSRRKRL